MLRANNSRFAVTPARLRCGVATIAGAGLMEAAGNKFLPGASRSRFGSQALTEPFGSMPEGYVHPEAWILPQKPGSLKVSPAEPITFSSAANLNIGRPLASDVTVTVTTSGSLDMIVAVAGGVSVAITTSGSLTNITDASGDSTVTVTASGALDMLVAITGTASITATLSANQTGVTSLSGEVSPFTELSPQNLARSVWESPIADYLTSGSTGAALNSVKVKTDSLTFTVAGQVDANTKSIKDTAISGSGTSGDPWGP